MNADLGISDTAFGLVAGIFFIAYFVFEVPSNIFLAKIGARIWIARILITWGIVIVATGFVQSVTQLYRPVPARCRGGRVLPRRHLVSDLLVSRP